MYESGASEIQWVCEKLEEYDALNNKHDKGYKYLLSVRRVNVIGAAFLIDQQKKYDELLDTLEELMPLFTKLSGEEQSLIFAWFKNIIIRGIAGEKSEELVKIIKGSKEDVSMVYGVQEAIRKELRKRTEEGKTEDRIEAILELLEDYGNINEGLRERITGETQMVTLKKWHKLAARVNSIDEFVEQISKF